MGTIARQRARLVLMILITATILLSFVWLLDVYRSLDRVPNRAKLVEAEEVWWWQVRSRIAMFFCGFGNASLPRLESYYKYASWPR